MILVAARGWPDRRRGWQVAKLSCRVGRTPAQIPADASASVKTGNLTEDCREKEERALSVRDLLTYSARRI